MKADILAPAAVLVLWTLVMLIWLASTRLPALKSAGIDVSKAVGGRGQDLEAVEAVGAPPVGGSASEPEAEPGERKRREVRQHVACVGEQREGAR